MFYECTSLELLFNFKNEFENILYKIIQVLPVTVMDIFLSSRNQSNWDTRNVRDMSLMFYGCASLKYLSDISKWDINNVTSMSNMFCECSKLFFFYHVHNELIYTRYIYLEN